MSVSLTSVSSGFEHWNPRAHVARHRHATAYAAIVLSGGYEECGSRGRFRVEAGDVLLHRAYDSHLDRFESKSTRILNLPLADADLAGVDAARVSDADTLASAAQRSTADAVTLLRSQLAPRPARSFDWPDHLAHALLREPTLRIGDWARTRGLAPETVARGFHKLFGFTPAAFRAEVRAHAALLRIRRDIASLSAIAAEAGFADQAHMTRAIKALTGHAPAALRASIPFKTRDRHPVSSQA